MSLSLHRPGAYAATGSLVLALLLTVAGCHKGADTSSSGPTPSGGTLTAGQGVFQNSGCTRCHTINGQGGRRGPDLSHVGADPRHTPQWLAAYVKNPQQVDPKSRMPAFGGRVSDSNLQAVGTYLASLK